jgi:molybdopterin-binding protein
VVGGRILDLDVPERVFFAPASEEVARFVGVAVIVPAQVRARRGGLCVVTAGTAEILVPSDAAPGEHLLVCLRPEDVVLAPVDGSLASASTRNVLLGKVRRIVSLGSQARVEVDAGFDLRAVVQRQALRDLALAEGQEVRACFDVEAVHAIRAADIHDRGRDRVAARRSPGAPGQEET